VHLEAIMRPAPLSPAQAAALRRAGELVAELAALTAAVRAHLGADESAPAERESRLGKSELRAAFAAAASAPSRRPHWADLLGE
jgi:hypothetical protein